MFQINDIGRWLIIIGLGIAALGLLLFLLGKIPFVKQLGRLPGDIRIQSRDGRVSIFIPIVSSILVSLLLTFILNVVVRLLNRK